MRSLQNFQMDHRTTCQTNVKPTLPLFPTPMTLREKKSYIYQINMEVTQISNLTI